ncbi:MAG TPA: hypothetical protein VF580_06190, partial [Thermoanaerobaculia bacterium]
ALEGHGFQAFERAVGELFETTDRESEAAWLKAVEDIRAGRIGENFTKLPRLTAEDPRWVKVSEIVISEANASENAIDPDPALAA